MHILVEFAQKRQIEPNKNMKTTYVVAAIITDENGRFYATQRGYGEWKDWWEFPGGKIEDGELPEEALRREIHEELDAEINVDKKLCTIEYDYPTFHLSMQCFLCTLISDTLTLIEHEDARWLEKQELPTVHWLPADMKIIEKLVSF